MSGWALYHDFDELKCEVVREAIRARAITDGEVICGDIRQLAADDVRGFRRVHCFAGGGFWDLALNLAGWGDAPAWTGSCPCPSFSAAGKGLGFADPRQLWPDWARLIRECRPATIFGEQAAAAIGYGWLDLVQADLEAQDYAVGKAVFGAHSAGAPHIRQRLYFGAHAEHDGHGGAHGSAALADCDQPHFGISDRDCHTGIDCDAVGEGLQGHGWDEREWRGPGWLDPVAARYAAAAGATRGFWAGCDWWHGRDGKYRPIGPGLFPLAHGSAARVGRLRLYGDAICVPAATAFLRAWQEARGAVSG